MHSASYASPLQQYRRHERIEKNRQFNGRGDGISFAAKLHQRGPDAGITHCDIALAFNFGNRRSQGEIGSKILCYSTADAAQHNGHSTPFDAKGRHQQSSACRSVA
jgi:hypothetical protein